MTLYPEIEPYEQGRLDVGNGNRVYWEVPTANSTSWTRPATTREPRA